MNVCGEEDKRVEEMERACLAERITANERGERKRRRIFFSVLTLWRSLTLRLLIALSKVPLHAGDLQRKCLAL